MMILIEIHAIDEAGVDEAIEMEDRLKSLGVPPEIIVLSRTTQHTR
jgi:hypothetical protein